MLKRLLTIYKDAMRYRFLLGLVHTAPGKLRLCISFSGPNVRSFTAQLDKWMLSEEAKRHGIHMHERTMLPPHMYDTAQPYEQLARDRADALMGREIRNGYMPPMELKDGGQFKCPEDRMDACPMDYSTELGAYFCTHCRHVLPKGPK